MTEAASAAGPGVQVKDQQLLSHQESGIPVQADPESTQGRKLFGVTVTVPVGTLILSNSYPWNAQVNWATPEAGSQDSAAVVAFGAAVKGPNIYRIVFAALDDNVPDDATAEVDLTFLIGIPK